MASNREPKVFFTGMHPSQIKEMLIAKVDRMVEFSDPCQHAPYPEGRTCDSGGDGGLPPYSESHGTAIGGIPVEDIFITRRGESKPPPDRILRRVNGPAWVGADQITIDNMSNGDLDKLSGFSELSDRNGKKEVSELTDADFVRNAEGQKLHPKTDHVYYRLEQAGLGGLVTNGERAEGALFKLVNEHRPVGIKHLTTKKGNKYDENIYQTDVKGAYLTVVIDPKKNRIKTVYPSNLTLPPKGVDAPPTRILRADFKRTMDARHGEIAFPDPPHISVSDQEKLKLYINTPFSDSKYGQHGLTSAATPNYDLVQFGNGWCIFDPNNDIVASEFTTDKDAADWLKSYLEG